MFEYKFGEYCLKNTTPLSSLVLENINIAEISIFYLDLLLNSYFCVPLFGISPSLPLTMKQHL